jgi:DNA-binding FrmR family transcriptional regulator
MKKDKKKRDEAEGRIADAVTRLNRILGQVDGIARMLEDDRRLDDVLMQCKAVHSALKSVEARILRTHLEEVLDEVARLEKRKSREQYLAELEALYRRSE